MGLLSYRVAIRCQEDCGSWLECTLIKLEKLSRVVKKCEKPCKDGKLGDAKINYEKSFTTK